MNDSPSPLKVVPISSLAPPGISLPESAGPKLTRTVSQERTHLQNTNEALALENARLANENMVLQNERLAQENANLRMQSQMGAAPPMPAMSPMGGMPYPMWPGMSPWGMPAVGGYPGAYGAEDPGKQVRKKKTWNGVGSKHAVGDGDSSFGGTSSFGTASFTGSFPGPSMTSTQGASSFGANDVDDRSALSSTPLHLRTTVMMRNIPNNYNREMLLKLVNEEGFEGTYDLIYLPMDFQKQVSNLGYSFINFVESEVAMKFHDHFSGFCKWSLQSDKVCEVTWSDALQGIAPHVERYRNSPVMHESVPDDCKPVLFKDGERIPFPEPTKRIRAPRQWQRKS